ncbi:MAG: hypothetical protein IH586_03165 [Anaerolineaceae bacterium]|nr:hypothetical protein [Anaerolineaceae bacterium]
MPIENLPLLVTKLHIPPARAAWLPRQRLFERLDHASTGKLTILSAPAGYGKTTLLAHWVSLRQQQVPSPFTYAWLTLDDADNDPVRFWSYLAAALQTCSPERGMGQDFFDLLRSPGSPALQTILILLINEIARIPLEMVLVMDDLQELVSSEAIAQLIFFIDHLPQNLHLVLCGRSEPLFPLARYRAHGQLIQLQAADLRFTQAETAAFFAQSSSLNLSQNEVNTLDRQAEGWQPASTWHPFHWKAGRIRKVFFSPSPAATAICWIT